MDSEPDVSFAILIARLSGFWVATVAIAGTVVGIMSPLFVDTKEEEEEET
jgi:hypothetical protein